MTTARMASSSMKRPVLFASAAVWLRREDEARDRRAHGREDIDREDEALRPHTGQAAGLGVDADRLDQQPERRAPREQGRETQDDGGEHHGHRDAEDEPRAEHLERVAAHREDLTLGDQHGDAAAGGHEDESGDDRLDAEHGDEEPVPDARARAR